MSLHDEQDRGVHRRGRFYAGLLTVLVTAVVAMAASALYVTAGGQLFGLGSQAFGMTTTDGLTRALQQARAAAWGGRHDDAIALYDSVLVAHDRQRDAAATTARPAANEIQAAWEIAIERARVLSWAERYDEAADALAAVDDPRQPPVRIQRARYLWWAGRPREADSLLSVVLERSPDLTEARELQALVRPSVEPAIDVAARWLREQPDDPFAHLWMARALVHDGRAGSALGHYRRSFDMSGAHQPDLLLEAAGVALGVDSLAFAAGMLSAYLDAGRAADRPTRLRLARAYAWGGRYAEAEDQYRQVLALEDDIALRLELSRMLIQAGRHSSAIAELQRILPDSSDPVIRRELATAFERDGQPERAAVLLLDLAREPGETRDLESLARVLAAAERYGEAALVLARLEDRLGQDDARTIRRSRYLWWSGQLRSADALLTRLLAESAQNAEAYDLREEIREGIDPPVELARRWVELDDTPTNRLRLARALADADQPGTALEHYALALEGWDRDLLEEAVGVAEAADSLDVAIRFLNRYVDAIEAADADLLLKVARLESWAGRPVRAEHAFRRFLSLHPDDVDARFSLAQQLAWQDSSRWAEAGSELLRVLDADAEHVKALLLLGDIRRWTGDAETALAYYQRVKALDPDATGLQEGVRLAQELLDAGVAPADITRVAWAVALSTYGDSEGFDWVASRLSRDYTHGFGTVSVGLTQGYSNGPALPGWATQAYAAGADVSARIPLGSGYSAVAGAGAMAFEGTPVMATWATALEYRSMDSRGVLRYDRSPAIREAGRFGALEAAAALDRVSLSGATSVGPWEVSGESQWQRFGSRAGAGVRYAAMVRSDRALGETGLTFGGMLRAISAADPAPVSEAGPLYWAPRSYIAPALTFGFGRPVGSSWWVGLRAAPGYAWIDERETGLARYRDGTTPTLEAGGTVGYRSGPWTVDLSADAGGALRSGYTSSSVSVQVTRTGGF